MKNIEILNTINLYNSLLEENGGNYDITNSIYSDLLIDELDYIQSELSNFISRYEKRYNTNIHSVCIIGARSSHYGAIGGNGAVGGHSVENFKSVQNWLNELILSCDDINIYIDEEKHFNIEMLDHDGINATHLYLATEKEYNSINNYDNVDYHLYNKGKKPVKLDNEFINNFGGYENE